MKPHSGGVDSTSVYIGNVSKEYVAWRPVTVNELIQMANIALGSAAVSTCTAGDANSDGMITVNEIVAGVNNALNGCPTR